MLIINLSTSKVKKINTILTRKLSRNQQEMLFYELKSRKALLQSFA